jgi:ABC transporter substrate binding protein (PQQ-dependent alcohol dehydrogenase system)
MKGRKAFFFEKKKQNTFMTLALCGFSAKEPKGQSVLRYFLEKRACLIFLLAWQTASASPIRILYLGGSYAASAPLSLVETVPADLGIAGARLALSEINITGAFLHRNFTLDFKLVPPAEPVSTQSLPDLADYAVIIADLEPADLLALADLPQTKQMAILDARTIEDRLRQKDCRANVFHLLPNRAMRADAIGQYLAWKQWHNWLLLRGESQDDKEMAADIHRSAERFGAHIVGDRTYGYNPGSRRVDTGYQQIQTQMPQATQGAGGYDVLFVADEPDLFGDYLPYNTFDPRPVVGTQGLVATAWAPAFQEYSALQMQHRFTVSAYRLMQERDYAGWLAVRTVGEAIFRGNATDAVSIATFLKSPAFNVAGFKGQALTFRSWDHQLRQPVLLATPLMVVSMSPQEGYLSPDYLTDTLGFDKPETECRFPG